MNARRQRRARVTLDAETGKPLAGFWSDLFGTNTTDTNPADAYLPDFPVQNTSNPDIQKQIVPAGTVAPAYVTAISLGFPSSYYDTWYFPTQTAITSGKAQAAIDTIVATGDQVGAAIQQVANVGAGIANNFVPLLIGIAALFLFLRFGGKQ